MQINRRRVLLVEDDDVLRRGLALIFSRAEADVLQVSSGRTAIDLIDRELLDLIVCDFRLSGVDGLGVLTHLRQSGRKIPFILMTAYYSDELAGKAMALGAIAVFEKPLVLSELLEQFETCLHARAE